MSGNAWQKTLAFSPTDTLREGFTRLVGAFAAAGLDTPEADARYLLRGVLGLEPADMLRTPERALGERAGALGQAAQRRIAREPVSRILGERAFFGRLFEVTPDVLDPRPDTEIIVEAVLELADRAGGREVAWRIADIGLGSGAILVTLLAELPRASGVGTDLSSGALACARRNAVRHGVASRLRTVETSVLRGVAETFDVVVSNPPYIPSSQIAALDPEVRGYDPLLALDGGADGLALYRQICIEIMQLKSVPRVVLEVGAGQADDVAAIFGNANGEPGLWQTHVRQDLGGHARCVTLAHQL